MPKKKTTEQFVADARNVHGDKYDYQFVEYQTAEDLILIVCPKHGPFHQRPKIHLSGCGCPACDSDERKRLIYGVGINDLLVAQKSRAYRIWYNMIARCYDENRLKVHPTYRPCSVCEEWHLFSNFKSWFDENYVEGFNLDKDLLSNGDGVYSPSTCCFLPQELNKAIMTRNDPSRSLPPGVVKHSWTEGCTRYSAQVGGGASHRHVGYYATPEEAFVSYKEAKEQYVKELAKEYYSKRMISKRVYDALLNFEVHRC